MQQEANDPALFWDSLVFEALIRNHYGEPEAFKTFRKNPTDVNHRVNNANLIIKAVA